MQNSLQVTFRNLERSSAVEEKIRERAGKLNRYFSGITSCDVAVSLLHKHHHQGNHYHVRVDVIVPGDELVASREPGEDHAYTDVYVAIRDAFDSMERLIEDYVRRLRKHVTTREPAPQGRVAELHRADDYGRIASADGRMIYFHRESVVDGDFDHLAVGNEVRFVEEQGDHGPQANTVRLVAKHRVAGRARPEGK